MSEITISGIDSNDVLGTAMFAVGVAILMEKVPLVNSPIIGIIVMVLGIGAVFGRKTFVELVQKLVLSNDELTGNNDRDGTSGSEGDDGTDDGEVGIDRPPGDDLKAET